IEYRWAGNQADRLPALVSNLVQLPVAVIVAVGVPSALAAKAATTSIPVLFSVSAYAGQFGLVAVLTRAGVKLTGANLLVGEFVAKGLGLLHELVPSAAAIGFLENPNKPISELTTRDMQAAAPVVGVRVQILKASTDREIDAAFAGLVQARIGVLFVGNDFLFNSRMEQLTPLAARYTIPTMYSYRDFALAGWLDEYGTRLTDVDRQIGLYPGRMPKGEKPADLPVIQAKKIG